MIASTAVEAGDAKVEFDLDGINEKLSGSAWARSKSRLLKNIRA